MRAFGRERFADLLADGRTDGAAIGDHGALADAFDQTTRASGYAASHCTIADAVENEIGAFGDLFRASHMLCRPSFASSSALAVVFDHNATWLPAFTRCRAIG